MSAPVNSPVGFHFADLFVSPYSPALLLLFFMKKRTEALEKDFRRPAQIKKNSHRHWRTQEEERNKIALDLHDSGCRTFVA